MLQAIRQWFQKQKLKKELDTNPREVVALEAWGFFDNKEDYETRMKELKNHYLQRGLTQEDIEKIWKNIWPVRIE